MFLDLCIRNTTDYVLCFRIQVRGIQQIVFYGLPQYPHFYSELCNMLHDVKTSSKVTEQTCTVLYSKYEALRLAEIVGTDRAGQMMHSGKHVHMFVTGENGWNTIFTLNIQTKFCTVIVKNMWRVPFYHQLICLKSAEWTAVKVDPDHMPCSAAPDLGQVVQNIVSLTSSLVVKMVTVLVSTIYNSQVFLLKKCE